MPFHCQPRQTGEPPAPAVECRTWASQDRMVEADRRSDRRAGMLPAQLALYRRFSRRSHGTMYLLDIIIRCIGHVYDGAHMLPGIAEVVHLIDRRRRTSGDCVEPIDARL